ncbi:hypothetical protein K466DRAFT_658664 [Polyporus arcularius HHB13444]|uniref:F-box domain-containing protein n=1 Tax=Polyporus arcularius HHB13444 TaxID=1314778 RepID=A0A5C3PTT9_9APHY|nr:hypothetical protein K466DRAFT_658664 [Polyporus arcularius HHB13444]
MSGCSTLLNDDILREIAFHASRPTCLTLMRTCKFLYSEGAKAALRHPVTLTHYMGMFKFLRFLHAGDRFRYVRELRICFVTTNLAGLSDLEESIRLMTGLEALLFDVDTERNDYAEHMLGYFLIDAISRIPHLRRISIKGADPGAKDLMRTLQTNSLESVLLNWDFARHWVRGHPPFVGSGDSLPSLHPVPFLAKWTSTLQELTCVHWYNSPVLLVYPHVYPHMRRLTITKASGYLLLAPLMRAYPNLAYLNVDTFGGTGIDYSDPEEVRSINVSSQHAADAPGPWRSLKEVVGPVDELYALGLQAPIGILRIVDSVSNGSLEDFTAVLRDVQPRGIQLAADGELFLPRFAKLVRGPGASRLENIDLRVHLHGDLADKNIAAMLDDLCSGLVRLPLRRLHIRLAANELRPPSHTQAPLLTGELHTPLTPVERSLDEFDVDAYVRRLASAVESLTEAVVEIQNLRQRSTGLRQSNKCGHFRRVVGSD